MKLPPTRICEGCYIPYKKKNWDSYKRFQKSKFCSATCAYKNRKTTKFSRSSKYQKNYRETHIRTRYSISKSSAKRRNLQWKISLDEYKVLMSMLCYYCNGKLAKQGVGLDRKDNSGGYSLANTVPCCPACNVWRADNFTVEETKIAMAAIKEYRKIKFNGEKTNGTIS